MVVGWRCEMVGPDWFMKGQLAEEDSKPFEVNSFFWAAPVMMRDLTLA